jgi:hypothetical protein
MIACIDKEIVVRLIKDLCIPLPYMFLNKAIHAKTRYLLIYLKDGILNNIKLF